MNNNIFNQLMELFEGVEHHLCENDFTVYASVLRERISKIVEPLDDQLIDWRLDPDPEPEGTKCTAYWQGARCTLPEGHDGFHFLNDGRRFS